MDKKELLDQIRLASSRNQVSKGELVSAYREGQTKIRSQFSKIFYYLGGAIVFLGIAVLVGDNWNELPPSVRIASTFGSGIAAYLAGLFLDQSTAGRKISGAFFLTSGLVLPLGLAVTLDAANWPINAASTQFFISLILFAFFLSSNAVLRKTVLTVFTIIFGSFLFLSAASLLAQSNPAVYAWHFNEYRALVLGISYLFVGFYFGQKQDALSGFLYGAGSFMFLAAAISLGGYFPGQNNFWEIIFPGIALGTVLASTYLKSRAMLVFGSLFLVADIIKLTSEYFSKSLGWPLALVIAGLLMIAVGYWTVYVDKKYIE